MVRATKTAESAEKKEAAAAKKAEKPAAKTARKTPVRKTAAAKKSAEPQVSLFLQYMGHELTQEDMVAQVKAKWAGEEMKTLELYIKPEDQAIYYVVNGEDRGQLDL